MIPSLLSQLAVAWLAGQASAIDLTVSKKGGNSSSPLLYGVMFEVDQPTPLIVEYLLIAALGHQ